MFSYSLLARMMPAPAGGRPVISLTPAALPPRGLSSLLVSNSRAVRTGADRLLRSIAELIYYY